MLPEVYMHKSIGKGRGSPGRMGMRPNHVVKKGKKNLGPTAQALKSHHRKRMSNTKVISAMKR